MIIIAEQIIILAIIGMIGYVAFKIKAINSDHNNGLVKVIIKIILPLLIFTTFAGADLDDKIINNFPYIILASFLSVTSLFCLSLYSSKILKLDRENKALHSVHTMFGNVAFLGFPLLNAVFPGGEGLIYAAIFQLGHDSLMWTWGILLMNKGSSNQSQANFNRIINPTTIAFFVGIIFWALKIPIPELIFNPLYSAGHTTIYLSMIYVGATLAQVKAFALISNFRSYLLSFNKLIIGPIILLGIFYLLQYFGANISKNAIISSVLQAAMPCMIIISVLAKDMGLNPNQAVENIFVSTVLSMLTLPLVFYIANLIF